MKKVKLFLEAIFIAFVIASLTSCSSDGGGREISVELGGDTDILENRVGYKASGTISAKGISGAYADGNITVKESNNGITTISGVAKAPYDDNVKKFIDSYYPDLKDKFESKFVSNGWINISGEFNCKNSTEGLAYINKKGKQAVIMKYDLEVGDSWTYTTAIENNKVKFKVIKKSTTNDYPYGMMDIKVMKVEQKVPYPGVSKIIYIANHKFGPVGVEVQLEDGTILKGRRL